MQDYVKKIKYLPSVKLTECLPFWKMALVGMEWNASPIRSPHRLSSAGNGLAVSVAPHWLSRGWDIREALIHKKECSHEVCVLLRRASRADQGEATRGERAAAKKKIKRVLRDTAWLPYLVTVKTVFCLLWRSGHNSALSGRVSIALFSTRWWEICFLKTQSSGELCLLSKASHFNRRQQ